MPLFINACVRKESRTKKLAQNFYGIHEVRLFQATGLDIVGADVEAILRTAFDEYDLIK